MTNTLLLKMREHENLSLHMKYLNSYSKQPQLKMQMATKLKDIHSFIRERASQMILELSRQQECAY